MKNAQLVKEVNGWTIYLAGGRYLLSKSNMVKHTVATLVEAEAWANNN